MTKSKRNPEPEREWMVPMRFLGRGTSFVTARTAEEALEKVEAGEINGQELDETFDWEIAGHPELND